MAHMYTDANARTHTNASTQRLPRCRTNFANFRAPPPIATPATRAPFSLFGDLDRPLPYAHLLTTLA